MHTGPMKDSEGTFDAWKPCDRICGHCGGAMAYRIWESSCGGYEDTKYKCQNPACGHIIWVDGGDS